MQTKAGYNIALNILCQIFVIVSKRSGLFQQEQIMKNISQISHYAGKLPALPTNLQNFIKIYHLIFAPKKEIISFGDSMDEYKATLIVGKQLSAVTKSVKFIQSPTPVELVGQLAVLSKFLRAVCLPHQKKDFKMSSGLALEAAKQYLHESIINHPTRFVPRTSRRSHAINLAV
mmetsp:Transcript_38603/g.89692  ORF Transcript_38603/g.89692 Transcript_38603/m.89692 type:complete len:174 (-) Transcript_38603:86-607(-)